MALIIPTAIADVTDLAALSAALGPSTWAAVRALVPARTDAALVKEGNTAGTPRIDDDALRLLRGGAVFLANAPASARARVNLSPEFIRAAAWSALQGHNAWRAPTWRTLLTSRKADVQQRIELYALTEAQLAEAEAVAAQTAVIAGKAKSPKAVTKQAEVYLWDGLNLAILEQVTRAFARGSAVDPTVPTLGFVSLRSRVAAKGKKAPGSAGKSPGSASPTSGATG